MDHQTHEVCRFCLDCQNNLLPLFEASEESRKRLSVARDIIRLEISDSDGYPKMVCGSCSTKLETIDDYVRQFQDVDRKLRSMIREATLISDRLTSSEIVDDTKMLNDGDSYTVVSEILDETFSDSMETKSMLSDVVSTAGPEKSFSKSTKFNYVRRSQRVRKKQKNRISPDRSTTDGLSIQNMDLIENYDQTGHSENDEFETTVQVQEKGNTNKQHRNLKRVCNTIDPAKTSTQSSNIPMLHDFKCYICASKPLGSRKALIEHLAEHVDKIPYTCDKCVMETVVLTRVRTLNTHMKMHEQPVKCDYCDRRYSNAAGKYHHTQTYHLGGGAPCLVNCDICGKQCGSKMALKQHMKYHTTSLKCSKCEMVFNHANKRRNHELTHDDQGGYECIVCKKVLQTIESYDVHLKKHSQERSYQCTLCPKKFNTSFNLILHLKVHAKNYNYRPAKSWVEHYTILSRNPMQFKCNHCDRYGTDKVSNMISHLQAHFKEYQCDRCQRLFATAKQLRAHYTTYTGEKSEMCQHCGKCFSTKNSLRIHLKTHARDDSTTIVKPGTTNLQVATTGTDLKHAASAGAVNISSM